MKTRRAEILAPAGDIQSFYAAVNAGADAVYLGLSAFNARAKAENFTKENIKDVAFYAHLFGVKVYVTVNTLVKDGEVDEFISLMRACEDARVDAYIIQDFGMAEKVKREFPNAILHASTQMGVNNYYAAKALKDLGFSRVVLSRETSLEDVKKIAKTGIEIEFFVQGALCVCFSGNCYLSSVKADASGNRGLCKQLCRLKYSSNGKTGRLLSPSDLCLAERVDELIEAGVCSLKIEGRLKRPSYVAQSVKLYSLVLDKAPKTAINEAIATLSEISSRGEYNSSAYLFDRDNVIDVKNHAYTGRKIGVVTSVKETERFSRIRIKTEQTICVGDGLSIGGVTLGVGSVEKESDGYAVYSAKKGIKPNAEVFRSLNKALEDEVLPKQKKISVDCRIEAYCGKELKITLASDGVAFSFSGAVCEKADKLPLDAVQAERQIRFADYPFVLSSFALLTDGVFMPKAAFNAARREAVNGFALELAETRSSREKRPPCLLEKSNAEQSNKKNYVITDEKTISLLKKEPADTPIGVVLAPTTYEYSVILKAANEIEALRSNIKLYLNLPTIATSAEADVLKELLFKLKENGKTFGVVANNYYGFEFLRDFEVIAGTGLNVYSLATGKALLSYGFSDYFSSIEATDTDGAMYKGNPPLMTMVHCPYKVAKGSKCSKCLYDGKLVYKDERGNAYLITRYKIQNCYFELRFFSPREYSSLVKNRGDRTVTDYRFFS